MRSILLGICSVLAAAACTIAFLALQDSHALFSANGVVPATVVRAIPGKDRGSVVVSLVDQGKRRELSLENVTADEARALKPTDNVEVMRHQRSPDRVSLRVSVERAKPSWTVAGAAVIFFLLASYLFVRPKLRRLRRARRTGPLDIVLDAVRDTRTTGFALSLFVFLPLGALIIAALFFDDQPPGVAGLVVLGLLFVVSTMLGLWQLARSLRMLDLKRSPVFRLIAETPERIGWVYAHVVTTNGVQATAFVTLQLWLTDGSHTTLAVDPADKDELIHEIAHRAPRALLGYTEEAQTAYDRGVAAGASASMVSGAAST